MSQGIYLITNKINGKKYVGQSKCIEKRWKQEMQSSNNNKSSSYDYPLMRAFRKYGIENFLFEIIEECDECMLNEKEIYWVKYFDTFFNGYNQTLGGDSRSSQPKEKIIGIINDLKSENNTQKEIANKWEISEEIVQGINTGRYWKQPINYPIREKIKTKAKIYYCEKCGNKISKGSKLCLECYLSEIKLRVPDKEELYSQLVISNGNFTKVGKIYKVSSNAIKKWCRKYNLPYCSSDYRVKNNNKSTRTLKIGVCQIDTSTNKVINTFESVSDACRFIGVSIKGTTHIIEVCRGKRKTAYGYKWRFND